MPDRYVRDGATVRWALRPGDASPWEAPTTVSYRLRWKVHGALTPVWGPRPASRQMPASSLRERLEARWRETREALVRAGPSPLRRYVLDLNVAAPGREGPVEGLEYGLAGDRAWEFAGSFMTVTLDKALPPNEGVDLSFFFDRKAPGQPSGVDVAGPAGLVVLVLLPVAAGLVLLGRTLVAWRRRRPETREARPLPDRPEELSPEIFASLLASGPPRAPRAAEVWARLRDAKAVALDRQEPPNLVLRADPSDLRPPEAALVGLLFGERSGIPLAAAREAAAGLGGRLDAEVEAAFGNEVLQRVGEEGQAATPRREEPTDETRLGPTIWLLLFVPFALGDVAVEKKVAAVVVALAAAIALYFATRVLRNAGLRSLAAFVPAGTSVLLSAFLFAAFYLLEPAPGRLRAVFSFLAAFVVLWAGFVGARPVGERPVSPLNAWALAQREALRERLGRSGGEVEPGEAPWFRAAGLEVSLSEPGVPADDFEELLGAPSAARG